MQVHFIEARFRRESDDVSNRTVDGSLSFDVISEFTKKMNALGHINKPAMAKNHAVNICEPTIFVDSVCDKMDAFFCVYGEVQIRRFHYNRMCIRRSTKMLAN